MLDRSHDLSSLSMFYDRRREPISAEELSRIYKHFDTFLDFDVTPGNFRQLQKKVEQEAKECSNEFHKKRMLIHTGDEKSYYVKDPPIPPVIVLQHFFYDGLLNMFKRVNALGAKKPSEAEVYAKQNDAIVRFITYIRNRPQGGDYCRRYWLFLQKLWANKEELQAKGIYDQDYHNLKTGLLGEVALRDAANNYLKDKGMSNFYFKLRGSSADIRKIDMSLMQKKGDNDIIAANYQIKVLSQESGGLTFDVKNQMLIIRYTNIREVFNVYTGIPEPLFKLVVTAMFDRLSLIENVKIDRALAAHKRRDTDDWVRKLVARYHPKKKE